MVPDVGRAMGVSGKSPCHILFSDSSFRYADNVRKPLSIRLQLALSGCSNLRQSSVADLRSAQLNNHVKRHDLARPVPVLICQCRSFVIEIKPADINSAKALCATFGQDTPIRRAASASDSRSFPLFFPFSMLISSISKDRAFGESDRYAADCSKECGSRAKRLVSCSLRPFWSSLALRLRPLPMTVRIRDGAAD